MNHHLTARKEKSCQEEQCVEQWDSVPMELRGQCSSFTYCPFCANEMQTRCSACNEPIHDTSFKFCPWCGVGFE
jgi:hypothetical protein